MLLAVALNPVLDNDIRVLSFTPGVDINPVMSSLRPGGKALNVARIWTILGEDAHIIGLVAGAPGALIRQAILDSGISHHLIEADGSSRICTNIIECNGRQTSIHQYGSFVVSEHTRASFLTTFQDLVKATSCCVVSGSLPPSVPQDFYADVVQLCREAHVPCIVDTDSVALHAALSASPTVIKINQTEAGQFLGHAVDIHEAYAACKALTQAGAETAIVTLSEAGAVVYESLTSQAWRIIPPTVAAVSSIGCGDAFAAGLSSALVHGVGSPDLYVYAAGVAAAVALHEQPDNLNPDHVTQLAALARAEAVS